MNEPAQVILGIGTRPEAIKVAPVYQALVDNGEDEGLARNIFSQARDTYHPLTVASIEAIFDTGRVAD